MDIKFQKKKKNEPKFQNSRMNTKL